MAQEAYVPRGRNGLANPSRGAVLLVDEDRNDLHYHTAILRTLGYEVRVCGSYEEGARLVGGDSFALIIVSQGTPSFEGRCVLERARQVDRHVPVLVVANCLNIPCYQEAMQLGAVEYLVGPVVKQVMERAVKTHLQMGP